ncbi:MAG: 50S ribosomal protein L10 [Peptococcaceae bacterium]|nr:50S ribosomal protein L10 [Peptococcaceae bacterium]MBT9157734.1 50S ribosomal protein L10 [Bacillota bacterium]
MGTRDEKQLVVQELVEVLQRSKGAVLTNYRGISVIKDTDLRAKLRKAGIEYRVVKNTLLKRAADEAGIVGLAGYLEGPTAIALCNDPVAPAKVLTAWIKANKLLEIKGGILGGKAIDANGVIVLAELPPRDIMLGRVVGTIQAPLAGLVNVLHGPLRKLAYAVDAVRQQREAQ